MREIRDSIAITGMFVKIDGYTDDQGNANINGPLSEARANAVKRWLQRKAPSNFPDSRFAVEGHGASSPVASNSTADGRAQNRRVSITLQGN
jgi:outer membrane protein OmpA-like peptidoglycan-associated protein